MIKIKINNEYELPTSWEEVKFIHYIKFHDLNNNDGFKKMIDEMKFIKLISIFDERSDELFDELNQLSLIDVNTLSTYFAWIGDLDSLNKIASIKPTEEEVPSITVDGEEFFIYKKFDKMTIGDKERFETMKQQLELKYNLNPQMLGLAFLMRKKNEEGQLEEFTLEFAMHLINNVIPKMLYKDVMYYVGFFLNGGKTSSKSTKGSSLKILSMTGESKKKNSKKSKKKKESTT